MAGCEVHWAFDIYSARHHRRGYLHVVDVPRHVQVHAVLHKQILKPGAKVVSVVGMS